MISTIKSVFFAILLTFGLLNVATAAEEAPMSVPGATTIDVVKAKALYDEGVIFIDPRTATDFEAGRIPEAELLPVDSADFTEANLEEIVAKDEPLVFYCNGQKCGRSAKACEKVVDWGWTEVYYLRDGFPGWKVAGYPVE